MILTVANIATALLGIYGEKIQQTMPLTNLTQNLVKILIIIIGGLMVLNGLGISITPLLTTLGIGGLAVALALQDTLSNLFAGFYITVAKNIRVGDFIRMEEITLNLPFLIAGLIIFADVPDKQSDAGLHPGWNEFGNCYPAYYQNEDSTRDLLYS